MVHVGVGGFQRAHQAVSFDELARRVQTGWGLVGVGRYSPQVGEVLRAQDCLYLVVQRGPEDDDARVVGAMTRYLLAADQREEVLQALADPRTRLVTLLQFVPAAERRTRREALLHEGALAAVCSWAEVGAVLTPAASTG